MPRNLSAIAALILGLSTRCWAGGGHLSVAVNGTSISPATMTATQLYWGAADTRSTGTALGGLDLTNGGVLTLLGAAGATPSSIAGAIFVSSGSAVIQSTSATAGHFVLDTRNNAGTSIFRIRQDSLSSFTTGPVNIGPTAVNANAALQVSTGATAGTNPAFMVRADNGNTVLYGNVGIGVSDPANFRHGATSPNSLHIGAGTDTNALGATTLLDMQMAGTANFHLRSSDNDTGMGSFCSSYGCYLEADAGTTLAFSNGTDYAMNFLPGANLFVGIGIKAPATKLHMSSGTLTVDGNATTSLTTTGRIGIGTSSPASPLSIDHATAPAMEWLRGGSTFGYIGDAGTLFSDGTTSNLGFEGYVTNGLQFGSNNNVAMVVAGNGTGLIGIGTLLPATKLHLSSGTATFDGNTVLKVNASSGTVNIGPTAVNANAALQVSTGATAGTDPAFIVRADNGRVGIGNVAPAQLLHVGPGTDAVNNANTIGIVQANGSVGFEVRDATNNQFSFMGADSSGGYLSGLNALYLGTNAYTQYISITNGAAINGQVGIGSDLTPDDTLLEITGAVGVTYVMRVSSSNGTTDLLTVRTNGDTSIAGGYLLPYQRTLAQIQAITPAAYQLGGMVVCSNCAVAYSVCISTGATVQGFRLEGPTLAECK